MPVLLPTAQTTQYLAESIGASIGTAVLSEYRRVCNRSLRPFLVFGRRLVRSSRRLIFQVVPPNIRGQYNYRLGTANGAVKPQGH